jgi:hypothetical protein
LNDTTQPDTLADDVQMIRCVHSDGLWISQKAGSYQLYALKRGAF